MSLTLENAKNAGQPFVACARRSAIVSKPKWVLPPKWHRCWPDPFLPGHPSWPNPPGPFFAYPFLTWIHYTPLSFFYLDPDGAALRLRFDPDYSPPSSANALAQPALYTAYNRPVFSRIRRPIKVRIETDSGVLVTSGPDSELVIKLTSVTGYLENRNYPGEQPTVDYLTAEGMQWLFKFAGSEHVYDPVDHPTIKWSSVEVG